MQYSKFTVLKVFIRTAKVFSLQFHSYHGILFFKGEMHGNFNMIILK